MKRRGSRRDQVLNQVADSFDTDVFAAGFERLLGELDSEEVRVVHLAAAGSSLLEIADHTGTNLAQVRLRLRAAIRRMQRIKVGDLDDPVLRSFFALITTEEADLSRTLAHLTHPVVGRSLDPEWCKRHQIWTQNWVGSLVCKMCPCPRPAPSLDGYLLVMGGALTFGVGRPRQYCSSACRQAAYRARRRALAQQNE